MQINASFLRHTSHSSSPRRGLSSTGNSRIQQLPLIFFKHDSNRAGENEQSDSSTWRVSDQLSDDTWNPDTGSFQAGFNIIIYKSVFALQNVTENANRIYLWNEIGLHLIYFNLIWWSIPSAPTSSFNGSSHLLPRQPFGIQEDSQATLFPREIREDRHKLSRKCSCWCIKQCNEPPVSH